MARPTKQGLDYFPLDVGFLQDIKIRKIMRACGIQSIPILISLLCSIYRDDGYYLEWDQDMPFLIADEVGVSEGAVIETVTKAVQVDFFNAEIFKSKNVLTSVGIQERFFKATERRKEIAYDATLMLIRINDDINLINVCNNAINVGGNNQSKVKQSKVKESRAALEKPIVAAAFTDEDDKDFEEVKNYFESYVKNDLSSMKDQVAITKALKEYPKDFIIQAMKSIVMRGTNNIVSFTYFEPVLSSAWEEKNKPNTKNKAIKKKKNTINQSYKGIDITKIIEEKQRQMLEVATND